MIWRIVFFLAVLTIVVTVPIQYKALNRIAFGRSIFISFMSIIMGLIVAMMPNIPAIILSTVLFLIGFGMLIFMAVKSLQRMRSARK